MNIVYEILIDSGLILVGILVMGAFLYSALILFKPKVALNLNGRFNSWFSTEKVDDTLDMHIDTNELVLKNRWWVGSVFLAGALFTLKYLLIDFDAERFISLVISPSSSSTQAFSEIIVISIQWLFAFTSFIGIIACSLFLINPEAFQQFSHKMDTEYSTEVLKDNADTVYTALDDWVMKNHILVGLSLFLGSTYLVVVLFATFA